MKKLLCACLGLAVFVLAFSAHGTDARNFPVQNELFNTLGVDVRTGSIIEESDTHGGFHGDGMRFVSLAFSDDSVSRQIAGSGVWSPLPWSHQLTTLAYGSGTAAIRSGPYLTDGNGAPVLPAVQNGYYFFYDRHSQAENPRDESAVFRGSFNFTLALYDTDTDTLYYVEFDT